MKKIFVVGPAWVGDMVMAQTLFKILKNQKEEISIDVLAPEWSRPLLERMPEVRKAHTMTIGHGVLQLKVRYQIAKAIRKEGYDEAIILPNSWKSGLIPWLAKIPKRRGFLGECRFGLLTDYRILDKKALPMMIERFAALAYKKGAKIEYPIPHPRLEIQEASVEAASLKFGIHSDRPILAICPGAEFGPSKRWPENYYAEIALAKLKEGFQVWIFGSKNDMTVSNQIQVKTEGRCLDFTGKTSLAEAIDLLSLANLVVCNDSGLMHIAAALEKPLVAVYGSTSPGFTPPLGDASEIVRLSLPCSPCFKRICPLQHHRCMQELSPQLVLDRLETLQKSCHGEIK